MIERFQFVSILGKLGVESAREPDLPETSLNQVGNWLGTNAVSAQLK
jgi:hypothetical protein